MLCKQDAGPRSGVFFLLLFLVPILGLSALSSQELNRVTFLNETGRNVDHVFFRSEDSSFWGVDILGQRGFPYGTMLGFFVHYYGDKVRGEFMVFDDLGRAYHIKNFMFSEEKPNVVEISVRDRLPYQDMFDCVRVYVTNTTNRLVSYLFMAPEKSAHWGIDILHESASLESGASVMYLVPAVNENRYFEVLAITKDHAVVQRRLQISMKRQDVFLDFTVDDLH